MLMQGSPRYALRDPNVCSCRVKKSFPPKSQLFTRGLGSWSIVNIAK